MSDISSKIIAGVATISVAISIFGLGSRGTEEIYQDKFRYQGKKVVVKHEDIRLHPDKYWIELKDGTIYSGSIKTDEDLLISVHGNKLNIE